MGKKRSKKAKKKRLWLRRASPYRSMVGIDPAAKPAYWYYRRFQAPSPVTSKTGPVVQPLARPVIHAKRIGKCFFLTSGFSTLAYFGSDKRTKCFVQLADKLTDEQIRIVAWRSVLSTERLEDDRPEVLVAKFLTLRDNLPAKLIPELLPSDPKTGRPLKMTVSSFARACGTTASTFNNFLPRLRSGGIADVRIEDVFKKEEKPDDG